MLQRAATGIALQRKWEDSASQKQLYDYMIDKWPSQTKVCITATQLKQEAKTWAAKLGQTTAKEKQKLRNVSQRNLRLHESEDCDDAPDPFTSWLDDQAQGNFELRDWLVVACTLTWQAGRMQCATSADKRKQMLESASYGTKLKFVEGATKKSKSLALKAFRIVANLQSKEGQDIKTKVLAARKRKPDHDSILYQFITFT